MLDTSIKYYQSAKQNKTIQFRKAIQSKYGSVFLQLS